MGSPLITDESPLIAGFGDDFNLFGATSVFPTVEAAPQLPPATKLWSFGPSTPALDSIKPASTIKGKSSAPRHPSRGYVHPSPLERHWHTSHAPAPAPLRLYTLASTCTPAPVPLYVPTSTPPQTHWHRRTSTRALDLVLDSKPGLGGGGGKCEGRQLSSKQVPQPPERPKHVRVWTPRLRLYTEDEAVFLEEPFATELASTLCEPRFIGHLADWLCFTFGAEIAEDLGLESLVPGQELFVDVLFTRYLYGGTSEGDTIAYKLLEAAQIDQVKYYRGFGDTPADFSLAQDFDARETLDSDSEHESDWEGSDDDDVLMDDTDTDYVPEPADESMGDMSPPPSDSESDLDLPCFVHQPTHKKLRVVPKEPLLPLDDQSSQICRWIHHIQEFFYSDVPGVRDSRLVVDDLVEMRAVPARVYNSEAFQHISEESGLFKLLHKITRPGNLIETTQPVITEAEWEEVRPKTDDPKFQFDAEKARGLLKFISDRPEMHPWGFNPMAKRKKGAVKRAHCPVKYYHPLKDLKMEVVEHRPDVYERCGKDIVQFMYKHVNTKAKMVGGVRFKAFSDKTLEHLIHNHRLVKVRAIRRCSIMQRWAYGSMTATGSRQASGGRRGDTYSAYACHRGDTPDDIKALFSEAMATDTIIAAGNTICPGLKTRLEGLTATSGVNYLGHTGVSNFTCSNYISCIHPDSDFGLEDLEAGRGRNNA
ncbi:hypothetical protein B0H14DRAFT_3689309 [Mycena olivaceomarginata]|nr:hypothetical protein B0H14DRAFT_3689309 [Mycena olivaceomarginata]